ncbi:MAG: hypothetical protein R2724_27590 [Bryobacterales bacterium]
MDLNFQLKAGSKAVDAGVALPTVNDGYNGSAPDLGAPSTANRSRIGARAGSTSRRSTVSGSPGDGTIVLRARDEDPVDQDGFCILRPTAGGFARSRC